jgi:transposase
VIEADTACKLQRWSAGFDGKDRSCAHASRKSSECLLFADIVEEVGHLLPLGRRLDSVNPADSAGETAMMGFQETPARLFYDFCLDEHVPSDHMLRGIDRHLDLADLRQSLRPFYSHIGRPSVDPELMIRMLIVGYSMGIRSERRLCEEVHLLIAGFVGSGWTAESRITRRSRRRSRRPRASTLSGRCGLRQGNPREFRFICAGGTAAVRRLCQAPTRLQSARHI